MKTSVLFIVTFLSWSSALSQNNPDLTGTWLINWEQMSNSMSNSEKQKFNALDENTKSRAEASFSNKQFDLKANGHADITWSSANGERAESGTWTLQGEILTLVISGQERSYHVALSEQKLTLTIQNPIPGALFSRLIFNRQ